MSHDVTLARYRITITIKIEHRSYWCEDVMATSEADALDIAKARAARELDNREWGSLDWSDDGFVVEALENGDAELELDDAMVDCSEELSTGWRALLDV